MTKKQLLTLLSQVPDEANIHIGATDVFGNLLSKNLTNAVGVLNDDGTIAKVILLPNEEVKGNKTNGDQK